MNDKHACLDLPFDSWVKLGLVVWLGFAAACGQSHVKFDDASQSGDNFADPELKALAQDGAWHYQATVEGEGTLEYTWELRSIDATQWTELFPRGSRGNEITSDDLPLDTEGYLRVRVTVILSDRELSLLSNELDIHTVLPGATCSDTVMNGDETDVDCGGSCPRCEPLTVIPGAAGWGMETPAGRGGTIYRVTNLDDSGEGSLRACVEAEGPRMCLFEISGNIALDSPITVHNPYITIAGQTAPSPGITLRNDQFVIRDTHDVLVQHIRVRIGAEGGISIPDNRDSIHLRTADSELHHVVVDHVSASWAVDEVVSLWSNGPAIHDITISNSLVSEALHCSTHPEGCHSCGMLVGSNTDNILIYGNLFAHDRKRLPRIASDWGTVAVVNNLIYNPGDWALGRMHIPHNDGVTSSYASIIGNDLILGPSSDPAGYSTAIGIGDDLSIFSGSEIYIADNKCPDGTGDVCINPGSDWTVITNTPYLDIPGLQAAASGEVYSLTLAHAGARPADRDPVDERVITSVSARTGSIIDDPNDVGGYPDLPQNSRSLEAAGLPENPNTDSDGDGYTDLEEWLHSLDCAVGGNC